MPSYVLCVSVRMRGFLFLRLARERIGLDPLRDVLRLELVERNRADDAQVIARRRQEHRDRAGHRDRVQHRDVAVAVDHDDVARRDVGVPHHLVRRRRAVGDEEAVVGVEDARGVALGRGHRAGVVEQLARARRRRCRRPRAACSRRRTGGTSARPGSSGTRRRPSGPGSATSTSRPARSRPARGRTAAPASRGTTSSRG